MKKTNRTLFKHILILIIHFGVVIGGVKCQVYTDIVQLYQTDQGAFVQDIFKDNGKKYIVIDVANYRKDDGIYFNEERVITFDHHYSIYGGKASISAP